MEPPSLLEMLDSMRKRLKRRNVLLDEVRKAYLKDVVVVRDLLTRREEGDKMASSLNLRPTLALYAPSECTFRVAHGGRFDDYGGHIEVIHRESRRVSELSKRIEELLEIEQESRFKAAKLEVQAQQDRAALNNQRNHNRDEREQLCTEISMLKDRLDRLDETALDTAQRTINGLQHQLEHAETRIKELVPLVGDSARSQQEAGQAGLLIAGKDHRISELEKGLLTAKRDLTLELERYNDLEKKLSEECAGSNILRRKNEDIQMEIRDAKVQINATQSSLDDSRRSEAELNQKLSDLQVEYTEAVQREEAEQEELQLQLENLKEETRLSKHKMEEIKSKSMKSELAQHEALTRACAEVEQNLMIKHQHEMLQLKDDAARNDEKLIKLDAKLKLEQEKRAMLDVELKGLRVEEQEHVQSTANLHNEIGAKLDEILTLLGLPVCPNVDNKDISGDLEVVQSYMVECLATVDSLREEKDALLAHLDQYKAKSDAASSSARLASLISSKDTKKSFSNEQLIQMLQENADGLSQLQTELDISNADRDRIETESKLVSDALEATQHELRALLSQDIEARCSKAIAQFDLSAELSSELDRARTTSQRCIDIKAKLTELGLRSTMLEGRFPQVSGSSPAPHQSEVRENQRYQEHSQRATLKDTEELKTPAETFDFQGRELRTHLVSATSMYMEALQQLRELESSESEFLETSLDTLGSLDTDEMATRLVEISSKFSISFDNVATELRSLRNLSDQLPANFSYSEMQSKVTMLEQAAKEAGESDSGKKGGREEELQRLKQRNTSQQNFIMELQEEVATMKGLMFAADEIKRQYSELEDKYRLLENEFTEKAENEVNSRKAKERIELQLTLAHADISTLTRDKESLIVSLKSNEDLISKLELKLMQTQRVYEDVVQHEKNRLETNRDVGTQFSPLLVDASAQTSFKTPGMTLRQINSFAHVPHRKWGPGLVTPAIIDHKSLETLELPLSYHRPTTSGSQGISQNTSNTTIGCHAGSSPKFSPLPSV